MPSPKSDIQQLTETMFDNFHENTYDTNRVTEPKKIKIIGTQQVPWGIKHIKANEVWSKSTGRRIKVAILDSGISGHKDLLVKGEFNVIEPGKPAKDDSGHGTLVAGIIAAKNNNIGVVGVAPDVELYAVKILNASGSGYLPDLVKGIEWCRKNHIQIINLSVTVNRDFPVLKESVAKAINEGIIIVASAGNTNAGNVTYPAAYPGVISVGSIDKNEKLDKFSSVGKVDFFAPGVNILSTFNDGSYAIMSGTSMAAPHISGLLALMLADKRNDINEDGFVSSDEVKEILPKCAEDIGIKGYDSSYGYGIIKVDK